MSFWGIMIIYADVHGNHFCFVGSLLVKVKRKIFPCHDKMVTYCFCDSLCCVYLYVCIHMCYLCACVYVTCFYLLAVNMDIESLIECCCESLWYMYICVYTRAPCVHVYMWHVCYLLAVRMNVESDIEWASYQMRKIARCACAGNIFPTTNFKWNP